MDAYMVACKCSCIFNLQGVRNRSKKVLRKKINYIVDKQERNMLSLNYPITSYPTHLLPTFT
jgi:hypothetical protein